MEENSWVNFKAYQNIHENNSCYLKYDLIEKGKVNIFVKYIDVLFKKVLLHRSVKKYEKCEPIRDFIFRMNLLH